MHVRKKHIRDFTTPCARSIVALVAAEIVLPPKM